LLAREDRLTDVAARRKAEKALKRPRQSCGLGRASGRGEEKSREGIETTATTASTLATDTVAARRKAEKALKHKKVQNGIRLNEGRGEEKSREGIETYVATRVGLTHRDVAARRKAEKALKRTRLNAENIHDYASRRGEKPRRH